MRMMSSEASYSKAPFPDTSGGSVLVSSDVQSCYVAAGGLIRPPVLARGRLGAVWSLQTDLVDLRASLALIKEIVVSPTQDQKAADFRALHEGEAFLIPNPWDAGSARILEALGFKALASTSSGFAFTLGRLDGGATLEDVLDHIRAVD